jgi:hypothetical protein
MKLGVPKGQGLESAGVVHRSEASELEPATTGILADAESNNNQPVELNNSITAATLHDLSHTWFSQNASPAAIKDSSRMLIHYADAHLEDRKHYTYRMFRLKKIMLNMPRRNSIHASREQILKRCILYSNYLSRSVWLKDILKLHLT